MKDRLPWQTENAVPGVGYGKDDGKGWYYMVGADSIPAGNAAAAMQGYWENNMPQYWAGYESDFGALTDPHVSENTYWETSHTTVYDLEEKKGYLLPFESFYSPFTTPAVIDVP